MKTQADNLLKEIMATIPNPDYETKKIVMALVAVKSGISKRKEQEVQALFTEAEELLTNIEG